MAESRTYGCLNCGLPLTRNPHPMAGKPSHLNIVGAQWGCLPCAETRANGRHRVYCDTIRWFEDKIRELDDDERTPLASDGILRDEYNEAIRVLREMEDHRRRGFGLVDKIGPNQCPSTGEKDCSRCSGEYCERHFTQPCDCDVVERHTPEVSS